MAASYELPVGTHWELQNLLFGLADNPSAPPDVLARLVVAKTCRVRLARRRDLPADAAAVLATDTDANVRRELAGNPHLPPTVQAALAQDADPQVRGRLAEGSGCLATVGMQGRHVPGPLPHEVYDVLARDPDPEVRRAVARNRHLPEDLRSGLLDDVDPGTAALASAAWPSPPAARIGELLARATGDMDPGMLPHRLDGPLPTEAAHALLARVGSTGGDHFATGAEAKIAAVADLDPALTDRFLSRPDLRAAVAANPTLPAEHVASLAQDPDNRVRAAVAERRGLDPVLRESIPVDHLDEGYEIVDWLLTEELSANDMLAFARSRHQVFRKTLAMPPGLPDEVVEILAGDESFAVRLFVCERQQNAPGPLLAQIVERWAGHSRWDMIAHRNLPADAVTRLARSGDRNDRITVAARPGLPAGTLEALLGDDDPGVRGSAASNPELPAARLLELLGAADRIVAAHAAANPALPVETMLSIADRAGL